MFRSPNANPFPRVIGTFMGRDALSLLVSTLDLGFNDTVLLPAYLCREVLKPFLEKTNVQFHDLSPDLVVDPREIADRLGRDSFRLVYIINYFGFLQPYRNEIKRICADRGVVLVEDCAHSLLTEGSGQTGDIVIYSFRKTLPLPDGGGIGMNMNKEVTTNFYPKIYSNILSVLSLAKSLLKFRSETLSRSGISHRSETLLKSTRPANKKAIRILPMSSFADSRLRNISYDGIIEARRRDFQFWQELAKRTDMFRPIFANLPSGVCPLGFPAIVHDRDALKLYLHMEGVHLKIHWHLPTAVGKDFVNSHKLSTQMCTLPIYPELGSRERNAFQKLFHQKWLAPI